MRKRTWMGGCIALGLVAALSGAASAASGDVPGSAAEIRPRLIGSTVPDVALRAGDGSDTTLRGAMGGKPTVLILYRGGW